MLVLKTTLNYNKVEGILEDRTVINWIVTKVTIVDRNLFKLIEITTIKIASDVITTQIIKIVQIKVVDSTFRPVVDSEILLD